MSKYEKFECKIVSKEVLIKALQSLDLEFTVHEEPVQLHGWRKDLREEKAHIIVPQAALNKLYTGCSNDLGFLFDDEKKEYIVICSEYDVQSQVPQRLKQAYAIAAIEEVLIKQKFTIKNDCTLIKKKIGKVNIIASKVI